MVWFGGKVVVWFARSCQTWLYGNLKCGIGGYFEVRSCRNFQFSFLEIATYGLMQMLRHDFFNQDKGTTARQILSLHGNQTSGWPNHATKMVSLQ